MNTTSLVRGGSGEMFDAIAPRYDLLNRIISFGVDQRWRRRTIAALQMSRGARVLDLATGTADLALRAAGIEPSATVVGLDPSERMLEFGRAKVAARGLDSRVKLLFGAAEQMPLESDSFDGVTMGFGIRNVVDRARALGEMFRVLKPGGRLAILELSEPRTGLLGPLARFHIHEVVPRVGALLSGAREYRYLQKSIEAFPAPEVFSDEVRRAGFQVEAAHPLTFGVAVLYVGVKP